MSELHDPYLHLEDLSEENEAWAKKLSDETVSRFGGEAFDTREAELYRILSAKDQLILAAKCGDYAYNFHTDGDYPRGLWRRARWEDYLNYTSPDSEPEWEILLDVGALGETEGESWVFGGAQLLFPDYTRALISLHPGGSDTNVVREFDVEAREFVTTDAFVKPNSKGSMSWVDHDHVIIGADFGEGTLTDSGYPLSARLWTRGTAIEDARQIIRGEQHDVSAGAYFDRTVGFEKLIAYRATDFRTTIVWDVDVTHLLATGEALLTEIKLPHSAQVFSIRDWALALLRHDWHLDGTTFAAGSLLAVRYDRALTGPTADDVVTIYSPTATSSLLDITDLKSGAVFTTLDNVRVRTFYAREDAGSWQVMELHPDIPEHSVVGIAAVAPEVNDDVWLTTSGFLTPTTLSHGKVSPDGIHTTELRHAPARFNAEGLEVRQRWATSKDGTQVPYFVVGPRDVLDGERPARTLLDGYGGFEMPELPAYIATYGKVWLEHGYVYALSNIRGGGEFGPAWHQAALKENRNKAYEDHAAVAEDLVAAGITTVGQLAATGGSNGGLLMGNMYTTYPHLFGAIVCRVPLLDMKRYSHLLAGASWMGEYGDPDTDDWEFMKQYSAYHNVGDGPYPPILITTSTRDDRVHPGHARKFYQLLADRGFTVYYHENTEGGHAGAADIKQRAHVTALIFSFLDDVLEA